MVQFTVLKVITPGPTLVYSSIICVYIIRICVLTTVVGKVVVKCNQNGKESVVKTKDLSNHNNGPLSKGDLTKGSQLLLNYKGKSYPVTFVSLKGLILDFLNSHYYNFMLKLTSANFMFYENLYVVHRL